MRDREQMWSWSSRTGPCAGRREGAAPSASSSGPSPSAAMGAAAEQRRPRARPHGPLTRAGSSVAVGGHAESPSSGGGCLRSAERCAELSRCGDGAGRGDGAGTARGRRAARRDLWASAAGVERTPRLARRAGAAVSRLRGPVGSGCVWPDGCTARRGPDRAAAASSG